MFAVRVAAIEERARRRAGVVPNLHDGPALAVRANMMPEEGRARVGVVADAVKEVRGILVHAVVDDDGFVLARKISGRCCARGRCSGTCSHGAVVLFMLWIMRV